MTVFNDTYEGVLKVFMITGVDIDRKGPVTNTSQSKNSASHSIRTVYQLAVLVVVYSDQQL